MTPEDRARLMLPAPEIVRIACKAKQCMHCVEADGAPRKPREARKLHRESSPLRPRCAEHWRAWDKIQKAAAAAKRSRERSGLDEETRQAVKALQGGACPCGALLVRPETKRYEGDADHDHALAVTHAHAENVACEECFRGFLCRRCNRDIIGQLSGGTRGGVRPAPLVVGILRALADYLEDPPMRRYLRQLELVAKSQEVAS